MVGWKPGYCRDYSNSVYSHSNSVLLFSALIWLWFLLLFQHDQLWSRPDSLPFFPSVHLDLKMAEGSLQPIKCFFMMFGLIPKGDQYEWKCMHSLLQIALENNICWMTKMEMWSWLTLLGHVYRHWYTRVWGWIFMVNQWRDMFGVKYLTCGQAETSSY